MFILLKMTFWFSEIPIKILLLTNTMSKKNSQKNFDTQYQDQLQNYSNQKLCISMF